MGTWVISDYERRMLAVIREHMTKSGITQQEIVKVTGIPKSSISRMLSGSMRMDVKQLMSICAALGTRTSDILSEVEAIITATNPKPDQSR